MVTPHSYRMEHSETKTTNANYGEYYRHYQSTKIAIEPPLLKILGYVDSNQVKFIEDLKEAVKFKSISGDLLYKDELIKMVKYVEKWMVKIGAKYECFYVGYHVLSGKKVRLPPVILGTIKGKNASKTVCIYGNIDVKKPNMEKWKTDPWSVEQVEKVLFGNGVLRGKGPLLCWFHAILAFKDTGVDLPVNVKFIIECMNHQRSEGLHDFLITQKQVFLNGIDYVVVTEAEWLTDRYPCISFACVGLIHFTVTITKVDGSKQSPKDDAVRLFEKLADGDVVLIPNFEKYVSHITPDEEQLYEAIQFNLKEYRKQLPPEKQRWSKTKLLMHFWRKPTILVDEIKECTCSKNDHTKVKREFVLKIVPNQCVEDIIALTTNFIKTTVKDLGIENTVDVESKCDTRPWIEDCTSINYEAARRATIQIYKDAPNFIREDRAIKSVNVLQMIERNILLMPIGAQDGNPSKENEHISLKHFYEGTKLMAAYLFQLAEQSAKPK